MGLRNPGRLRVTEDMKKNFKELEANILKNAETHALHFGKRKKMRFSYMREMSQKGFPEDICHLENDDGYDLFCPVKKVVPAQRTKLKPRI